MTTEGSKTDLLSQFGDTAVSEDLGSSQSIDTRVTKEDILSADLVASKSTSEDTFALDETSGIVTDADNHIAKESYLATTNPIEKSSDAAIASSANEESGDSGTSFVKTREPRIRRVSFASRVFEDDGTGRESTTAARVAREGEDRPVNNGCCPERRGLIGYLRIKMMYFRESRYLLPVQIVLLALPFASGFMGAENIYRCPASPAVAILFFMMGIIGTVFLFSRIYTGFKKAFFVSSTGTEPSDSLPIAGLLLLAILFTTELACFFNMDAEFSPTRSSEKYCDAKFYSFARWMNYSGVALIILVILVHCPSLKPCTRTHVPHVTHELIGGLDY